MKINYIILSVLILASCANSQDRNKENGSGQRQAAEKSNTITFTPELIKNSGIDTGKLPVHAFSGTIHVNGLVDVPPQNLLSINVPMGGFLKQTTMLPGEPVRKGQIIAKIQNQDYITLQQDYLTANSRIAYLKQEMERQQVLSQQQASPLKLYQQSLADYNSEQAQAAGLAQKLMLLGINPQKLTAGNISSVINIYSPMSGYVSRVNINMGKYVNPTDVLMELVNTDDIHAALTVFEKDISKIAIGNKVRISLPSLPDRTYPGKVILIGRMLDTSRSVMVHCHFLRTDRNILPNMFLQASIETRPEKTLALPDDALVNYNGKHYIFISNPHGKSVEFSMLPVEVGVQESGWNAIKLSEPGLEGRDFVLKGAFSILSAMKNTGEGD